MGEAYGSPFWTNKGNFQEFSGKFLGKFEGKVLKNGSGRVYELLFRSVLHRHLPPTFSPSFFVSAPPPPLSNLLTSTPVHQTTTPTGFTLGTSAPGFLNNNHSFSTHNSYVTSSHPEASSEPSNNNTYSFPRLLNSSTHFSATGPHVHITASAETNASLASFAQVHATATNQTA